jgi:hypothetical protein
MTTFAAIDRAAEPGPGMVVGLPEVLLPIRWWRGVPVRQAKAVQMTPMERFTLELALTLGRADPDEFTEVTNLPRILLPAAARRLVSGGALAPDRGGYIPVRPVADQAATSQTVLYERRTQLDIVLLPRTGDLIALDPGDTVLRGLDQSRPRSAGNAPVPAPLRRRTLADVLDERLARHAVPGCGEDTVGVAQLPAESPLVDLNGLCPVYQCTGALRRDGDQYTPIATFPGRNGRPGVTLELRGADRLARQWLAAADILAGSIERAAAWTVLTGHSPDPPPRAESLTAGQWRCWIGGADAARIAGLGRNLALPLGLRAQTEEGVTADIAIYLEPADAKASRLTDLDRTLTAAQRAGDASAVPPTLEARDRAWRLGFHTLVYALREAEDFAYE